MSFPSFFQRVSRILPRATSLLLATALLSGCPNSFSEFANKTSDEALLFKAQVYADASDWDNAILTVSQMSATGRANRETKYALSSYYAGRCGLDLLNLADSLSSSLGTTLLYPLLLTEYKTNTVTNLADCQSAENTLLGISTSYASLTADENIMLALLEFTKIGSILGSNAKVDANGDGTYDSGTFDPCLVGDITDLEVGKLGTGLIISINALSASGSDIGASLGAAGSLTSSFGNVQDPTAFDANQIKALRGLFKSNEVGFNTCGGSATSGPACLCP